MHQNTKRSLRGCVIVYSSYVIRVKVYFFCVRVLLIVHLSIILVINQLNAQNLVL